MTTKSYDMLGNRVHRRKEANPRDTMLADFLRAKTAEEKRKVIESFAPHYFILTPTAKELKQRKEEHEQQQMEV